MAVTLRRSFLRATPRALGDAWRNLRIAVAFLTCLPVAPRSPIRIDDAVAADEDVAPGIAGATIHFPLIGGLIGGCGGLALLLVFDLGLHPLACALIGLATMALLTGALHEDGLADFCDGLGGGRDREHKLAIMHDSAIGGFGALALVFAVAIKAAVLSGLFSPYDAATSLVAAGALSRTPLPAMLRWLPRARDSGLAAAAGRPSMVCVVGAWVVATAIAFLSVEWWAAPILLAAAAAAGLVVAWLAHRHLGGITGDGLGAAQVLAELAVLIAIAGTE